MIAFKPISGNKTAVKRIHDKLAFAKSSDLRLLRRVGKQRVKAERSEKEIDYDD